MSPFAHDLVTCALLYLAVGAVIWSVLNSLGLLRLHGRGYRANHAFGHTLSVVIAIGMAIVLWPMFAWVLLRLGWSKIRDGRAFR